MSTTESDGLLDRSILTLPIALPGAVRQEIITRLWTSPQRLDIEAEPHVYQAYFEYYENACATFLEDEHAARTHWDIVRIVSYLNSNGSEEKSKIRTQLCHAYPHLSNDSRRMDNSIELAARLWLMINIRSSTSIVSRSSLIWPESSSLAEVIRARFGTIPPFRPTSKLTFSRLFNVCNLERIGGFRILWTDNLLDHLALDDDGMNKAVYVYYHVTVLQHLRLSIMPGILPDDFLDETVQTIALLLPSVDVHCDAWIRKREKSSVLDPKIRSLRIAPRNIETYKYWRDRLMILEEAFDTSEPANIAQWWYDRRKKVQWYTFWVAILVLILTVTFGLTQSITGIIQAWASVKGLH